MDYKATLNLPQTPFPMKANLPQREQELLQWWDEMHLYTALRETAHGKPKYILHDGPPYANGRIHVGHVLNKILKDLVIKTKQMEGFDAVYVPGWDCHGLPIEHQVGLELGAARSTLSKAEIRRRCRAYAERFIDIQRQEFKRLGVLGAWEHPYMTMSYAYEAAIVRELGKFLGNGGVFRGLKPVYWCASCVTALAEAEVEYEEHRSPSVYVAFPMTPELGTRFPALQGKRVAILIWTTTPWTLLANLAVAFHPDLDYVAVEVGEQVYIVAKELAAGVFAKLRLPDYHVLAEFKGKELEYLKARHPFLDQESLLVLGPHVTLEQGTGAVHTAPGHGQEDFDIGERYGLPIYNPVDDHGRFKPGTPLVAGQQVFAANETIIAHLRANGSLLLAETYTHPYPYCWRCKNPVLFRSTAQWFISMTTNNLRQRALEEIQRVEWLPARGENRIYDMISNRPDWCISRQRAWGVPITVVQCSGCEAFLLSQDVAEHVASLMEQAGADVWFERSAAELLPPGFRCTHCGSTEFRKEEDILDVWFDSGVSHAAVLEARPELHWPADMYLEGSDQHRGWFHSSLLTAIGTRHVAPYRTVLTHGFVVDGEGRKMSKSVGNVEDPQKVISRFGAEIFRLWVAHVDYREDVRLSDEILLRLTEAYRRIRNTCRFLLGNLYDFDPARDRVAYEYLPEIDRFMLHKLAVMATRVRRAYREYAYHMFYHTFHNFCTVDLSAFYLDVLKDRLYTQGTNTPARRAAQTVLYDLLMAMVRLMAPVLAFTADELWRYIPGAQQLGPSVHLTTFDDAPAGHLDAELAEPWERLLELRREVAKGLELMRQAKLIGQSLDAHVELYVPESWHDLVTTYADMLDTLFIVSKVTVSTVEPPTGAFASETIAGLHMAVYKAPGTKCERCWRYQEDVGSAAAHPTVCGRCAACLQSHE
jgi:isoleucyl-tRNA synthetase